MIASLVHAWRSWTRSPGVALLAIITFAVGLGSATAIFTVISGVMLRPVPYPEGDRFTVLFGARVNEPGRYMTSAVADLTEYQQQATSFDLFEWFRTANFNMVADGDPQYVPGVLATPALVHGLGIAPMLGRWFDDDTGAVLAYTLWRRLGANPDIVGTAVTLDDRRVTITGVMPQDFRLPVAQFGIGPSEIWMALPPVAADERAGLGLHIAYARRKAGVSLAQAQADVKRVAARIAQRDPIRHAGYTADLVALRHDVFGELRMVLLALLSAAAILVLIACANVATLLLARAVSRARETAIQVALGVSRRQLAVRYFVEASGLALVGAGAGTVFSVALVHAIVAAGSEYLPATDELPIDWRVLLFGSGIAGVASVLASLAPLWQATRLAPNAVLTEGSRATAGAAARRLSQTLVVAEIALAFTLLTVASILVVHLQGLGRVAPGFDPNDLTAFEITVPERINQSEGRGPYVQRLNDALRTIPGIAAVAFGNQLPLNGCCEGGTINAAPNPPVPDTRRVSFMFTTPEYLDTMRIPLRAGRFHSTADMDVPSDSIIPAVINEAAAQRYWPGRNPLGIVGQLNQGDARFQVIGVAGNVRNDGLNASAEAELYLPWTIFPINPLNVVVRSALPPERLIPLVRRAVRGVDATLAIHDVRPMTAVLQTSLQLERVSALMMVFFAVAAVVMATLGVYGVVAYAVRQRTVEMGTRMALGALGRDLVTLIVGGGVKMAAAGIAVGGVALVGATWLLGEFLDVRDTGWLPYVSSTVLVAAVTAAASYAPAWRTTLLSPVAALRDERASALETAAQRVRRGLSGVREAVLPRADERTISSAVLSDFVSAARTATSHGAAMHDVLAMLCTKLGVSSAALLDRRDGVFRPLVSTGTFDDATQTLDADGFLIRRLEGYPLPLPFAVGELTSLEAWAAEHRPEHLDEIRWLAAASVCLAVPLRTRTETTGVLLLGAADGRATYTSAEKQWLRAFADQFALLIENGRLTERAVEQENVRRDLALATEVQRRLLPAAPPSATFAEFAAVTVPARSIGGDYYDFIHAGDQQIGIAIADVSGKGIAAALIMSVVQASLRSVTARGDVPLPRLTAMLNDFLYRSTPASKYATFFYAQIDGVTRHLRYVNAGHNPPYLFRHAHAARAGGTDAQVDPRIDRQHIDANGHADVPVHLEAIPFDPLIEELSVGGMVVGMFPDAEYEEGLVELCPGDVLVAFTDGVPEAHNPSGDEFGEERLKLVVREALGLSAADITSRVAASLKEWIQDAEQYDDLTVVVMKVADA